jgi:carboxylesterase type B
MYSQSFLVVASLIASVLAQGPASVKIDDGEVVGVFAPSGVRSWKGIPFAKSPPERFSPPQDPVPWKSPLTVTNFKPSCMPQFPYPEQSRNLTIKIFSTPMPELSEDCLYLNVWAPGKKPPADGWPVMFWIYGGNLQFGGNCKYNSTLRIGQELSLSSLSNL